MACFIVPFLVVWATVFFAQMRFFGMIAPAALSRWAQENGLRIERQRTPLLCGPFTWSAGAFRRVYRVTVRDQDGHQHEGWVCLGRSWRPCLSVQECAVEVQWG